MLYYTQSVTTLALPINLKLVCGISCPSSRGISHTGRITMTEEWRPILGYEGIYEVSSLGRIKSLSRRLPYKKGGTRLTEDTIFLSSGKRYIQAALSGHGKARRFLIHRLVATAFLPNPENKRCVNHIDNDPTNNRLINLEWVTHKENMQHSIRQGRQSKEFKNKLRKE